MISLIFSLLFVGMGTWWTFDKFIANKLDCPANSEIVKGLEKSEIRTAIKEAEKQKKDLEAEAKKLETERKGLKDDKDAQQEKQEAKEEKIQELATLNQDLSDLKAVSKGGFTTRLPNRLTMNNALWIGGLLLGYVIGVKLCEMLIKGFFRAIKFNENES